MAENENTVQNKTDWVPIVMIGCFALLVALVACGLIGGGIYYFTRPAEKVTVKEPLAPPPAAGMTDAEVQAMIDAAVQAVAAQQGQQAPLPAGQPGASSGTGSGTALTSGYATCPPPQDVWDELGGVEADITGPWNGDPMADRCAFHWDNNSAEHPVVLQRNCPPGYICTANVKGDNMVYVYNGSLSGAQMRFTAVTYRKINTTDGQPIYSPDNHLASGCGVVQNDWDNIVRLGQDKLWGLKVFPANFTCPGFTAAAPPVEPPEPTGPTCPTTAQDVSEQVGGNATNWSQLDLNAWKYKGPATTLKWPGYGKLDYGVETSPGVWGEASLTSAGSVNVDQATFKCQ